MKQRISNKQTDIARVTFVVAGFFIPFIGLNFLIEGFSPFWLWTISILSVLSGVICLYFSFKLNTVMFDHDFIYCSHFGKAKKIKLDLVLDIHPKPLPF